MPQGIRPTPSPDPDPRCAFQTQSAQVADLFSTTLLCPSCSLQPFKIIYVVFRPLLISYSHASIRFNSEAWLIHCNSSQVLGKGGFWCMTSKPQFDAANFQIWKYWCEMWLILSDVSAKKCGVLMVLIGQDLLSRSFAVHLSCHSQFLSFQVPSEPL